MTTLAAPGSRADALRQARRLNRVTITWNIAEAVAALAAGFAAGSIGLLAFGADSLVEVSAALVLAWRLHRERVEGCTQPDDKRATRAIAISLYALAAVVAVQALVDLAQTDRPEASPVGVVIAALSLVCMPVLARAKRRLAPALGSRAVVADADQTNLCALLSAVLLIGLVANAAFEWWWADPVAALGIAVLAGVQGYRIWRAESLADTCCD